MIGLGYLIVSNYFYPGLKIMRAIKKIMPFNQAWASPREADEYGYPTGMVWCPMKMSGMGIMRCARLQRKFGCGTLRELRALKASKPEAGVLFWPWLKHRGECPERATEEETRELLLAITPLKLVKNSENILRSNQCPRCGGRKGVGARQCRPCWKYGVQKERA